MHEIKVDNNILISFNFEYIGYTNKQREKHI